MSALTRHWELKLLALAFSFALWLFVMSSEKTDMILSAPVEFEGVPHGMVVRGERPDTVDVQIHGLRGTLARLGPDQVKARVSLFGVREGEVTLRLLPEQVAVPAGVTVLRVSPSWIRVVVGSAHSSRLPLAPELGS